MAAGEIHEGDIGTVFEVTLRDGTTAVDLSAATTMQMLFGRGNGTVLTKTATLSGSGTDGKMRCTSVANDLVPYGRWKIQAFVVIGAGQWKSDVREFAVHCNVGQSC